MSPTIKVIIVKPLSLNFSKSNSTLYLILVFLPAIAFSQSKKIGTIDYLKYKMGYNGIVLGANIGTDQVTKLAYLDNRFDIDADSCVKYEYRDTSLLKIDKNLNLDLIGIRTYKSKIVDIYLFFRKPDGYKVLQNFLTVYGLFTSKPDDYVDIYDWRTNTVSLSLRYQLNTDLGLAIFKYNPLEKEILERKNKILFRNFLTLNSCTDAEKLSDMLSKICAGYNDYPSERLSIN